MRLVKGVTSGPLRSAPAEAGLVEMLDYSLVGQRVIGLENQQVVCPARQDLLGDCGLAAHGVQRHDAVLQRELVQQFRDGCDLVGRLMDAALAQHEALLARPGTHEVQGGSLPAAIERAPERLAINGDHLALKAVHEGADPGREPALEGIGIDEHEHAPEGIVRWNAVGQVQEGAQPRQFAAAVEGDVVPALGTGDHGADRNHQNVDQAVLDFALAARVLNTTEMPNQAFDGHDPLLATERTRHHSSRSGPRQKFHAFALGRAGTKRPAFEAALAYLRPEDQLVVWKVDRLGRSLREMINTAHDLQQQGVKVLSLTEQVDTETATGRLMFNFLGTIAEYFLDLNRERTVAGLKAALARGRKGGRRRKLSDADIEAGRAMLAAG